MMMTSGKIQVTALVVEMVETVERKALQKDLLTGVRKVKKSLPQVLEEIRERPAALLIDRTSFKGQLTITLKASPPRSHEVL